MGDTLYPVVCSACGVMHLPIKKVKWLGSDVKHDFYKCPSCEHVTTIWISDSSLRGIMATQRSIKASKQNYAKKQAIAKSMMRRVEDLKKEWLV